MKIKILVISIFICFSINAFEKNATINVKLDRDNIVDTIAMNGLKRINWSIDDPLLKQRTIVIFGNINEIHAQFIIEKLLYLNQLNPKEEINVYLRSFGGWLDDAFAIIDIINEIDCKVNIHALGNCESAGLLILSAASGTRTAGKNTILMFHSNQYDDEKNPKMSLNYKRFSSTIQKHTTITNEWLENGEKNKQYYFGSKKALELQVIDKIRD